MDKFGRSYVHHETTEAIYLVNDIPKLFYVIQYILRIIPYENDYIFSDHHTYHEINLPSGVITYASKNLRSVDMFINNLLVVDDLIGRTLNKGDIITVKKKDDIIPRQIEFGVKIPISR